jgi:hypothetical protein
VEKVRSYALDSFLIRYNLDAHNPHTSHSHHTHTHMRVRTHAKKRLGS